LLSAPQATDGTPNTQRLPQMQTYLLPVLRLQQEMVEEEYRRRLVLSSQHLKLKWCGFHQQHEQIQRYFALGRVGRIRSSRYWE
jgi:hypothetical protein